MVYSVLGEMAVDQGHCSYTERDYRDAPSSATSHRDTDPSWDIYVFQPIEEKAGAKFFEDTSHAQTFPERIASAG